MQKTLVLIKPDAVQRGLIGDVTSRFEKRGLKLVALKMMQLTQAQLEQHYQEHKNRDFFPELAEFMQTSPVIVQCWEGKEAIEVVRNMCGPTNARNAIPGTIRGDLAISQQRNIVHASDTPENAQKEIEFFFETEELFEYKRLGGDLIYSKLERN